MGKRVSAEKTVKEIRRKTRRKFSAEEKIRIVPRCQGPTTWLEVATEPDAIDQAMADHGLAPQRARPPPPPRLPPHAQLALPL